MSSWSTARSPQSISAPVGSERRFRVLERAAATTIDGKSSASLTTCVRQPCSKFRSRRCFCRRGRLDATGFLNQAIIVVRTNGDPLPYAASLRKAVQEQEPSFAVDSVMTMEERVMRALTKPRLYAVVLAGFASFAVTIAAVGLFGVLSHNVAQRAREIGVRTALGARPSDVVRLVLRHVLLVAAAGI